MRNVPMFDKPAEQPVELSERLSAFEYRLDRGEKAKWTAIRVKGPRPCQECAYMQHQTGGQFGPRRQAKHRPGTPDGSGPGVVSRTQGAVARSRRPRLRATEGGVSTFPIPAKPSG
jgi:hypothetical protein